MIERMKRRDCEEIGLRVRQRTGQSFESERNASKLNTLSFNTTLPHTSAYSLSTFTASCLSFEFETSTGVWREDENDKLFVMKQVNLNFLLFNHTWP